MAEATVPAGGFFVQFHPRILGTPAPVFPGFEFDFLERVDDDEKRDAIWHRDRAKRMIEAHPEIKDLFGHSTSTAIWCVLFAGAQIALAMAMSWQPLWVLVLTAYVVGAWINICLFQLAHECNHSLVFEKTSWNRWLFTLTSLPMFLSGHHTWWTEHHTHHNDLGARKDFIKRRRSFLLKTRQLSPMFVPFAMFMLVMQVLRSVLGLLYYLGDLVRGRWRPSDATLAVLADEHLVASYRKSGITLWGTTYAVSSLALTVALAWYGGWKPLVYLLLAQTLMTGFLHPIMFGLILSNSHFHGYKHYQPSSSYYGWLNWITFNFGLHTEHHDLCRVPWNRLQKLREIAPEFYDTLGQTTSYAGLAWKFAFGQRDVFEQQFNNEELRNAEMLGAQDADGAAA